MKKIIALILSISLVFSLAVAGMIGAAAEEGGSEDLGYFYLCDPAEGCFTGWWLVNADEGALVDVEFDSPVWFNGVYMYIFSSRNDVKMTIEIYDGRDDLIYSQDFTCFGDDFVTLTFERPFTPGSYRFSFVYRDNSDLPDHWFVLGSAELSEDFEDGDIIVSGAGTNSDTKPAPYIALAVAEADPAYETPTAEPTPTQAPEEDTPAPEETEVPEATEAPEATDVPQTTEAPEKEPEGKKGCGGVIGGGLAVLGLMACGAFIVKRKH